MDTAYIELSYAQVGLATSLVVLNGVLSVLLRLGLARRLFVASTRTAVQLLGVGLVLNWAFAERRWYIVLGLLVPMTLVAGLAAVQRTDRRYPGIWLHSIGSIWVSAWLVTAFALLVIVRPRPWYLPQYVIPFAGLVLGNTLTGISLGLERVGEEFVRQRAEVDALLALGATRWEAARTPVRQAVRAGMIPMINAMMVAGIVSLPGMMTGQLLSGVPPSQAVKYQIVVMFLLAAGTAFGTIGVVLLSYRRLFNAHHQFLRGLITERVT